MTQEAYILTPRFLMHLKRTSMHIIVCMSRKTRISAEVVQRMSISATTFNTEEGWDFVRLDTADRARKYSGSSGPQDVVAPAGTILKWSSDGSVKRSGWTLCASPPPPETTTITTEASATEAPTTISGWEGHEFAPPTKDGLFFHDSTPGTLLCFEI